jgi:SBP domain
MQVPDCGRLLARETAFYQRYHTCKYHARLPVLEVREWEIRFCQQVGRRSRRTPSAAHH